MAGMDYLKCEICGIRIMYEPDRDPDIKVVCMACYNKNTANANCTCNTKKYYNSSAGCPVHGVIY